MTENEAIKYMLSYKFERGRKPRYSDEEIDEAFNVAITDLKEIQQYRLIKDVTIGEIAEVLKEFSKIGTVEECREAVEKQKGMQVNEIHVDEYFCPACGSENNCDYGKVHDKYCPICGHAIYQEESEER